MSFGTDGIFTSAGNEVDELRQVVSRGTLCDGFSASGLLFGSWYESLVACGGHSKTSRPWFQR
ncbi:hypothetical protein BO443_60035 [Burkholderia orbicola]